MKTIVVMSAVECGSAIGYVEHAMNIITAKRISEKDKKEVLNSLSAVLSILSEDLPEITRD